MAKIVDVANIPEFKFKYSSYDDLIQKLASLQEFCVSNNIYTENHHIIPKCEGGPDVNNTIRVPLYFHFKLHLLRGEEATSKKVKNQNFRAAQLVTCTLRKFSKQSLYDMDANPLEWILLKQKILENKTDTFWAYREGIKGLSYEERYGAERAAEIKAKQKASMKTSVKYQSRGPAISEKRKEFLKNNPYTEEQKQARSFKMKGTITKRSWKVICLNDGHVYDAVILAAKAYNIHANSVRACCNNESLQQKGWMFQWHRDCVDFESIFRQKTAALSQRWKKWS
jgi:hypothetical protein